MAKMGKRQMIILGVMAIAVLYVAFVYLAPQKKIAGMDMAQKTAELKTFVADLTGGLGKDSSKNLGVLIFSRAEREWPQDPFLDSKAYKSWSQVKVTASEAAAPILSPAALKDRPEPILISSRFFQMEIEQQIRSELGLGNELIMLYDV